MNSSKIVLGNQSKRRGGEVSVRKAICRNAGAAGDGSTTATAMISGAQAHGSDRTDTCHGRRRGKTWTGPRTAAITPPAIRP